MSKCDHQCSGNCRRVGCNCLCGEWHCPADEKCRYESEECPNHPDEAAKIPHSSLKHCPSCVFPPNYNCDCSCHPTAMSKEKCKSSLQCSHNTNGRDLDKPCSIAFPLPSEASGWKKWFEANYLDGDKIQDGQTFSSQAVFEAIQEVLNRHTEEMVKRIEGLRVSTLENDSDFAWAIGRKNNQMLDKAIALIRDNKEV